MPQKNVTFRAVARFVWGYFVRRPLWLGVVTTTLIVIAAAEVIAPYFVGQLTDYIATHAADGWPAFVGTLPAIGWIIGTGVAFWIFQIGTNFMYDYFLKFPAMRDSATDVFYRVQRFATDWHVNSFAGATVRKITRGMWSVERFADQFYGNFIPLIFILCGTIVLLTLRWQLMGLALAGGAVLYAAFSIFMTVRFVAGPAERAATADTRLGASLADNLSCNATVKLFARERDEDAHIGRVAESWRAAAWRNYFTHNSVDFAQSMAMTLIKAGLFLGVAWLWATGRASVGDTAFVVGMYGVISSHLRQIGNHIRELQHAEKDLADMVAFYLTTPTVVDAPDATPLVVTHGDISFEHISFRYPSQTVDAYTDLSLTIRSGERVALVGHSGAGKSTLVKLVQRLYDVGSGRIIIDGQDIARVTQESLRRNVALVPQEPILFHRSLAENIAYGKPNATMDEIVAAARHAHAHEFIEKLPAGYGTLVGERGVKLSGGERQRVAIARAILADTPILILDEATSSLDSISEKYIQDALEYLMRGKTVIVVAHRLSTIKSVDRILVFDGGRIVEEGTHRALVGKKDGVYRSFYQLQASGFLKDADGEDAALTRADNDIIDDVRGEYKASIAPM